MLEDTAALKGLALPEFGTGPLLLNTEEEEFQKYLHNLLCNLSGLINIQSVFSVSDNRVQRPPFTEAAARGEK